MEEFAVKITGVCKKYHSFELKHISLELEQGYILGVVGRNGAGKTTLMKSILNPSFADGGEIMLCGMDAVKKPLEAKQQTGVLMEEAPFLYDCACLFSKRNTDTTSNIAKA